MLIHSGYLKGHITAPGCVKTQGGQETSLSPHLWLTMGLCAGKNWGLRQRGQVTGWVFKAYSSVHMGTVLYCSRRIEVINWVCIIYRSRLHKSPDTIKDLLNSPTVITGGCRGWETQSFPTQEAGGLGTRDTSEAVPDWDCRLGSPLKISSSGSTFKAEDSEVRCAGAAAGPNQHMLLLQKK